MLPNKDLIALLQRFPNAKTGQFHIEPLWMLDAQGDFMGYVDVQDGEFCLLKYYKHRAKAEKALKGVKYRIVEKKS